MLAGLEVGLRRQLDRAHRLCHSDAIWIGHNNRNLMWVNHLVLIEVSNQGDAGAKGCGEMITPHTGYPAAQNVEQPLPDCGAVTKDEGSELHWAD